MLFVILFLLLAFFAESCYVAFMRPDMLLWQSGQEEYRHVSKAFRLLSRHNRLALQTMRAVSLASLLTAGIFSASFIQEGIEKIPTGLQPFSWRWLSFSSCS